MLKKLLLDCVKYSLRFIRKMWYGRGYRQFGIGSVLKDPMRIIGKKFISIGDNCYIQSGLRMEAVSCWEGKQYTPKILIQDGVTVGQNCHFTCAGSLVIGEGSSILPHVLITDIEHQHVPGKSLRFTGLEIGSVTIGENVTVGMGARILGHKNISIGDNAVIATNAVVCHDVPADTMVAGIPARIVKQYDFEHDYWRKA